MAIAAEDATFGLSEVNCGIIRGGVVSWYVVNALKSREAMFDALAGDTFEGIRAVRGMSETQAMDYLAAKSDALWFHDAEGGREEALKQFLDEKAFRPGLGHYERGRDTSATKT